MGILNDPNENFGFVRELHKNALDQTNALARWVMASLLLLNGGALVAMADLAAAHGEVAHAAIYFGAGAILSVATGIFAWFNFMVVAEATAERLDWVKLEAQHSSRAERLEGIARIMAVLAIIAALASLTLFGVGAYQVGSALEAMSKAV